MSESDEQLLKRVGASEALAFAELYARFAPRVLALLLKSLRDHRDADDVLQETFWQVWRTAASYDSRRASPVAWILLIARSRAIDTIRRQKRHETEKLDSEPVLEQDPARQIEALELTALVRDALLQLDMNQQQLMTMAFYGGFPHQEIANRLRIPLGTVKTRIRQALIRLRTILRSEGKEATS